ncbi:hypothetical protein BDV06DRAFT_199470 [Aspergillus oleicola]
MFDGKILTERDSRSLDVLRIHQAGVVLIVDVAFIRSKKIMRDAYDLRCSQVVDMAECITAGFRENACESGLLPTLLMDSAVISPLYYIIETCCKSKLRHP